MSREIKFKFWLGHTKKMTYPHGLGEIGLIIPLFTEDIIPLQFTGLLDKNGKEIYEGDILSRRGIEDGEVRYEKSVWIIFSETSSAIWKQELHNHYHHTEIIGNIYQKI